MKLTKKIAITLLPLSLLFTSCYTWWEHKIDLDTESVHAGLDSLLYQETPITSLNPPEQVLASQGLFSGQIKLHWTDVENAASYRIERCVVQPDQNGNYQLPDEDEYELLEKYVYSTNYTDTILSNPLSNNEEYFYRYYYRISAENLTKCYESSVFTDKTQGIGWLLPAPQNIDAWKGKEEDKIKITWNEVAGASNYKIYRGEKANGLGMELLANVSGRSPQYTDVISEAEQGSEFYYKVCAILKNGSISADSNMALGYSLKKGAPKAPDNLTVTNGYGQSLSSFDLSWEQINPTGTEVITYAIYRNSSENSTYSLVKNNIPQGTTKLTDSENLKKGVKYYYYIQTIYNENNEIKKSSFSETGADTDNPALGFLLSAPNSLDVSDGSTIEKSLLIWSPAVGDEAHKGDFSYQILSSSKKDSDFTPLLTISSDKLSLNSDNYYSLEVEKHNFYKMITVNSSDLESEPTDVVAPIPAAPKNVFATKNSGGELLKFSPNAKEIYPVKITWEKPEGGALAGYNIFRSTKKNSSFRKLNEELLSPETTFFIDENPTSQTGTYYYYKVVSINELGQGKKSNDPEDGTMDACGYGAITQDQWFREYNKTVISSQGKLKLMHKSNDMDKLGKETVNGSISGTLYYNAAIAGLGAEIVMRYDNYADFYIGGDKENGPYFEITGNTDTTSNMSANGNMHGTVDCIGMYPGKAVYDSLEIKKGAAGGGGYKVTTYDNNGTVIFAEALVDWKVGEER